MRSYIFPLLIMTLPGALIGLSIKNTATHKSPPFTGLTAVPKEIDLLVKGPPHDAADEYKRSFFNEVVKNSIATESIDITDCKPRPIIAKVKSGSNLIIKNNGSSIRLELTQAHGDSRYIYQFDSQSEAVIKTDFGKLTGAFAYYCDAKDKGPVGIIYLSPD